MIDIFNSFEKKFEKELKKDFLWTFMRMKFYYALLEKSSKAKHSSTNFKNKLNYILNLFYGIKNVFKKYDYYFFSDSGQRKKIDGKYFDKLTDPIIKNLGQDKCLQFELPSPILYNQKDCFTKNIISQTWIELFGFVLAKLYLIFKRKNKSLYERINNEYDINIKYTFHIVFFEIRYQIFKIIFKIKKPKAIYIVCYYDKAYIVKAAKDLNILVIELQHGIIGEIHPAYFSNIELNQDFIPDYLLSFGKYEKNVMQSSKGIYESKQVFPIGHFYIENLFNTFEQDSKLSQVTINYDLVFGVTLQDSITDKLLNIIEDIAFSHKNYLFIIIPREPIDTYRNEKMKNIILFNSLDCYQKILHCNFHITVYSSCAIEAPSLGIENMLFNIDKYSDKYFGEILASKNTIIINAIEEFDDFLKNKNLVSKKDIIQSNAELIIQNYQINIKYFIKKNILC